MEVHAGTVIGGIVERSGPQVPAAQIAEIRGMTSAQRSNTSAGGAQSRPMTITRRPGTDAC